MSSRPVIVQLLYARSLTDLQKVMVPLMSNDMLSYIGWSYGGFVDPRELEPGGLRYKDFTLQATMADLFATYVGAVLTGSGDIEPVL